MKDANIVYKAPGAETSSTNHTAYDHKNVRPGVVLEFEAIVSAVSGTSPTLGLKVQESADNSTWTDVASFGANITAVGVARCTARITKRYSRTASTIGGTSPSFNYEVNLVSGRP